MSKVDASTHLPCLGLRHPELHDCVPGFSRSGLKLELTMEFWFLWVENERQNKAVLCTECERLNQFPQFLQTDFGDAGY